MLRVGTNETTNTEPNTKLLLTLAFRNIHRISLSKKEKSNTNRRYSIDMMN